MAGDHPLVPPAPVWTEDPPAEPAGWRSVPWGLPDVAAVAALGFFLLPALAIVVVSWLLSGVEPDVANAVLGPTTLVVLALTTVVWVATRHPGAAGRIVGRRPRPLDALVGLGVGILAVVVITAGLGLALGLILQLLDQEIPTVQQHLREAARDPQTAPILVFSALVVAPIAEELFFRGMLFPALAKRLGLGAGIVLSAVLFGFVHLNQAQDVLGGVLLFARLVPLGLLFAWLYHWRGTLVIPMIVHSVFNAASVLLLLVGIE